MAEFVQEFSTRIAGDDGTLYAAKADAEARADGTWTGWLEFHPAAGGKASLKTGQETSQPNRMTIEYWASGLEPVYLEGAFVRARRHSR